MQQILEAHSIPVRLLDLGLATYFGVGSLTALQVSQTEQQLAAALLDSIETEIEE